MSIASKDLPVLLKLLEQHPEWREALRALLFSEELLQMPQEFEGFRAEVYRRFAELAEALTRSIEAQTRLIEAQTGVAERVARLEEVVAQLVEAQARLEEAMAQLAERVGRLEEAMAQLAERVGRLEEAMAQLAERVGRLEEAMAQLAERVGRLEEAMAQLAERVGRLEARMVRMEERLMRRLTAFGARWGLRSERAWREGMRAVLEATGFDVERWVAFDASGMVFDAPSDVELDVIIRDGKIIIVELRTSVSREMLPTMERKVKFYEQQTGRKVDRRILITPWYEPGADAIARRWGWELYGEPEELQIEE